MHDIRAIRETPELYEKAWAAKGRSGAAAQAVELDAKLRAAKLALETAQAARNAISKEIGTLMGRYNQALREETGDEQHYLDRVEQLKGEMQSGVADATAAVRAISTELHDLLAGLPNLPLPEVPVGADEHENIEVRRWGEPYAISNPRDHVDLGEGLGLVDFEAAARMSGARFVVLKGQIARLERAIGQFMLDMQTQEHGYTEVSPPLLVREQAMYGTGQLPKFEEDLFQVFGDLRRARAELDVLSARNEERRAALDALSQINTRFGVAMQGAIDSGVDATWAADGFRELQRMFSERKADFGALAERFGEYVARFTAMEERGDGRVYLIPTAEVSLTNVVRDQIVAEEELPLRMTALTPCFRSEAGASGRDTRGMIRQHQFYKVELVSITAPDKSEEEHERMVGCAEAVLKALELPFRTMLLCTGDMGFGARKTYDLEVWIPSEGRYREISSCSNCGDFQARRMNARTKKAGEKGTRFVHSLNGSGLAVGRTLVAVMENYQDEKGRIAIPQALHRYLPGLTHIGGE